MTIEKDELIIKAYFLTQKIEVINEQLSVYYILKLFPKHAASFVTIFMHIL